MSERLTKLLAAIACPDCEGRGGKPRKSFGIQKCSACDGSGIRPSLRHQRLALIDVVKRAYAFGLHDTADKLSRENQHGS